MRITITLDDDLAELLRETAHRTGRSFQATINETLRAGLELPAAPLPAKPYRLKPASLGGVEPGFDLDKALRLGF